MQIILNELNDIMLIERVVGVSTYCIVLFGVYFKIKGARNYKAIEKYLNIYIFLLCIMSFFYIPTESADLYKWREIADEWMNLDFIYVLNEVVLKSSTPIGYALIFICQKTGINGLLPLICSLIYYGNVFHVLKISSRKLNAHSSIIATELLFIMSAGTWLEVISGIRCMVAFSIVARFAMDEILENKSIIKSIVFYVIACLIHSAAVILVGFRVVLFIIEKRDSGAIKILKAVLIVLIVFLTIKFGSEYIGATLEKARYYLGGETYSYKWEYIIGIIQYIIIIYFICLYYRGYNKMCDSINRTVVKFLVLLAIFELLFVWIYSVFHRFIVAISIISIPFVISMLSAQIERGEYTNVKMFKLLCIILLVLACVRGNLCGYKFFIM